ncbi:FkbM family methyltransferase [Maribacter algarum]|uniref:FkbM family methyltransferase n=1 Tax=Maribacter algarum (ex Zhang et al. 2020) TaxID=2578118 RepID=A0A5S3PS53_9FLAO|nr:FkbM family methyltransferase [Maribacter algarum]TMM57542.1 FkbM family methyltransferase [Maribacter algarum]
MGFKIFLRNLFQQATGLFIYKNLPFGINPLNDIQRRFPNHELKIFFDVGANVGEYVDHIQKFFPNAEISCFEPISTTFEILKSHVQNQNVNCYQIGLGSENTEMEISIDQNSRSDMNSLVNVVRSDNPDLVSETIQIRTLDDFCSEHSVTSIDYLKIDTEGFDLEVLKGARNFIQNQYVSFVEVEVSMNPENTFHVDFVEVKHYMENFGYRLFGIYDQMYEWQTGTPILRRTNPVFVSELVYKKKSKA